MELEKAIEAIQSAVDVHREDGDYIEGGILMCGKCRTPKQARITIGGKELKPYCLCKCAMEEREAAEAKSEAETRSRRIAELRSMGFHDSELAGWTFEMDDAADERLSRVARNYVEHFDEMLEDGKGLLLWGGTGSGKTFAAACIANALIDRGVPCMMTNFARLTNEIGATFDKRQQRIDGLNRFDLLVIDDLASERETEYMNEIVYSIIDARYRTHKPLIVTTNLTADELKNPETMHRKRVYSRLMEMCVPVKVEGADRRRAKMGEDYKRISSMLGL